TAAQKPAAIDAPSATSTEDEDRTTVSAEQNTGDHASVTEPEAANDDEPVSMSLDRDASDRTLDRQLAYLGLLDGVAPLFRDGSSVPGVGVLLALPCLVESGLFRISRKLYGDMGPAFHGLRTTLLTLLLMALLRIKRPEHLKEKDPAAFGRLLGLDRAPEVKTLRRRLTCLAAQHCAEQLGAELAGAASTCSPIARGTTVASMSGGSSAAAPSSTGDWWSIFCTISLCAFSRAGCACDKSPACATPAIRRTSSQADGTCATSILPIACSNAGDRRTSSSTCEKSSCSTRSSITRSNRKTQPAPSPIPSAGLWTRRSVRPALMSPGSNENWVPPTPVMPNGAGQPCGASR